MLVVWPPLDKHRLRPVLVPQMSYNNTTSRQRWWLMRKHEQVEIEPGISVDYGIAPLIRAVRAVGLITQWSCQGGDGHPAYIVFATLADAWQFFTDTTTALVGPYFANDGRAKPEGWLHGIHLSPMYPVDKGDPIRGAVYFGRGFEYVALQVVTAIWTKGMHA